MGESSTWTSSFHLVEGPYVHPVRRRPAWPTRRLFRCLRPGHHISIRIPRSLRRSSAMCFLAVMAYRCPGPGSSEVILHMSAKASVIMVRWSSLFRHLNFTPFFSVSSFLHSTYRSWQQITKPFSPNLNFTPRFTTKILRLEPSDIAWDSSALGQKTMLQLYARRNLAEQLS